MPLMGAPEKKKRNDIVYSIIKCSKCDHNNKRKFEDGDFVHKILGECNKSDCEGKHLVNMIYAENQEKKSKKLKKSKK